MLAPSCGWDCVCLSKLAAAAGRNILAIGERICVSEMDRGN